MNSETCCCPTTMSSSSRQGGARHSRPASFMKSLRRQRKTDDEPAVRGLLKDPFQDSGPLQTTPLAPAAYARKEAPRKAPPTRASLIDDDDDGVYGPSTYQYPSRAAPRDIGIGEPANYASAQPWRSQAARGAAIREQSSNSVAAAYGIKEASKKAPPTRTSLIDDDAGPSAHQFPSRAGETANSASAHPWGQQARGATIKEHNATSAGVSLSQNGALLDERPLIRNRSISLNNAKDPPSPAPVVGQRRQRSLTGRGDHRSTSSSSQERYSSSWPARAKIQDSQERIAKLTARMDQPDEESCLTQHAHQTLLEMRQPKAGNGSSLQEESAKARRPGQSESRRESSKILSATKRRASEPHLSQHRLQKPPKGRPQADVLFAYSGGRITRTDQLLICCGCGNEMVCAKAVILVVCPRCHETNPNHRQPL